MYHSLVCKLFNKQKTSKPFSAKCFVKHKTNKQTSADHSLFCLYSIAVLSKIMFDVIKIHTHVDIIYTSLFKHQPFDFLCRYFSVCTLSSIETPQTILATKCMITPDKGYL